jgi:hypothetical protein
MDKETAQKFNLSLVSRKALKDLLAGAMGCKYYPDLASALAKESAGGEKKTRASSHFSPPLSRGSKGHGDTDPVGRGKGGVDKGRAKNEEIDDGQ